MRFAATTVEIQSRCINIQLICQYVFDIMTLFNNRHSKYKMVEQLQTILSAFYKFAEIIISLLIKVDLIKKKYKEGNGFITMQWQINQDLNG